MKNQRNYKQEFETLVKLLVEMRRHQQHYFRHKDKQSLGWAKGYERRIDKIMESESNPKLF